MANERIGTWAEQSPKIFAQGLFAESSTKKHSLGTIRALADGRVFAYCEAGGTALAVGKCMQSVVPTANHLNESIAAAAAVGDQLVTVTLGATAATANDYADGWLYINDAAGEGHAYKVKSHPAADASAALVVTLYDSIRVALTTSSEGTLIRNPYKDVIIMPSPNTAPIVGVTPMAVTADYFFWLQVRGPVPVLTNGTVVIGQHVRASDAIDGAVEPLDRDGTAEDEQALGVVMAVNADTEYSMIFLNIG